MKKNNIHQTYLITGWLFMLILLIPSCESSRKLSLANYSAAYNPVKSFTRMPYAVYHQNDSISEIYMRLKLQDFLYEKPNKFQSFRARFKITFVSYNSFKDKEIIDSNTYFFTDSLNYGSQAAYPIIIPVRTPDKSSYYVNINLLDLNKRKSGSGLVHIDKRNAHSRQNFMITTEDGQKLLRNYIDKEDKINIQYLGGSRDTLYVNFYSQNVPVARPPFTQDDDFKLNFSPDSSFILLLQDNQTKLFSLPQKGYYHFRVNSNFTDGLTIYRFYEDFPNITSSSQMLFTLKYLTTKGEYEKMTENPDTKEAVDAFWLEIGGNKERAKSLIRRYYTNITLANKYFSSFTEGWKTDRGMIYTIFGPPDIVFRNNIIESWTYGESGNIHSPKFTFTRMKNPFCDNDYVLTRSASLKDDWYMAIESWRR